MREIVPAATASLVLAGEHAGRQVTLATVLPMAWPGLVRQDGELFVGLQVPGGSGDASRDVAHALELALDAEPGTPIAPSALPGAGARLQDLLDTDVPLQVTVHDGFDFWLEGVEDRSPDVVASMERANEAVVPTVRLTSVEAAYWCQIRGAQPPALGRPARRGVPAGRAGPAARDRWRHGRRGVALRRVVPRARPGRAGVGPGRAGTSAEALEEPVDAFAGRLAEALVDPAPLSDAARRARDGLRSRQLTLR